MKLSLSMTLQGYLLSPPSRGRGLKPCIMQRGGKARQSPPSRGRGLKPEAVPASRFDTCRPPRGGVD